MASLIRNANFFSSLPPPSLHCPSSHSFTDIKSYTSDTPLFLVARIQTVRTHVTKASKTTIATNVGCAQNGFVSKELSELEQRVAHTCDIYKAEGRRERDWHKIFGWIQAQTKKKKSEAPKPQDKDTRQNHSRRSHSCVQFHLIFLRSSTETLCVKPLPLQTNCDFRALFSILLLSQTLKHAY